MVKVKPEGGPRRGLLEKGRIMWRRAVESASVLVKGLEAHAALRAARRDIKFLEGELLREMRVRASLEERLKAMEDVVKGEDDEVGPVGGGGSLGKPILFKISFDDELLGCGSPGTALNRPADDGFHCWGSQGRRLGSDKPTGRLGQEQP